MSVVNADLRKEIVGLVTRGKGGHIPSAFSIVDIINTLYADFLQFDAKNPEWSERDYFILSKGHGCAALYAVLHKYGFLTRKDMNGYLTVDGILGGHPDRTKVPGVEASTGSLGHGLPFGLGIALGQKIQKKNNRVVVLVGDGECHEGTIWESALVAQNMGLNNVCLIVDLNGSAEQILPHPDIANQWRAFGWVVFEVDGHNQQEVLSVLQQFGSGEFDKPVVIVAHTVKGKGVARMETHGPWHYKIPDETEFAEIIEELSK